MCGCGLDLVECWCGDRCCPVCDHLVDEDGEDGE